MLIFGRYKQREPQGLVAEICPNCGMQPFWVVASFTLPHLFFVPFGRINNGMGLCCSRCNLELEYQSTRYSWMLPPHVGADYDVVAMARKTTPALSRGQLGERVVVNALLSAAPVELSL